MIKNLRYLCTLLLIAVVSGAWGQEMTVEKTVTELATENNWTISAGTDVTCYTEFSLDDIVTVSTTGQPNCGSVWNTSNNDPTKQWRLYQNKSGNVIISVADGYQLKSITLTFVVTNTGKLTYESNTVASETAVSVSGNTATFLVGNSSTATNGQVRITGFSVTYAKKNATDKKVATVTIGTTSLNVNEQTPVTTDGPALTLTTSDDAVASVSGTTVTGVAAGTATITATWDEDDEFEGGTKTFTVTVVDPNSPGTEKNPYTVAQARAAIDADEGLTEVYATGVVSEIVTAFNPQYGNISYNISADGKTSSDQLQAYRGKSYNGENFASEDDIQVGDEVVVFGNLKKHNSIYEFDAGNQLVSLKRSTKEEAGLAFETTEFTINLGESFTAPALTNPNNLTVTWESSNTNVATVANDGTVTLGTVAGYTEITASFAGNDNYLPGSASYKLTVVDPNAHGTADQPYTVAEAIVFINTLGSTTSDVVYVKGVISQVDSYNGTYKSITYWISDDGKTTTQMQVYSGKGLDSADFSSKDDLKVGDEVTVCGNVKMFNGTPEFDKNNYLVAFNRPAGPVSIPTPSFNPPAGEVVAGTKVEIVCPDEADGVEYSFDSENWVEYSNPIEITETVTIYARAYGENSEDKSEVVSAKYTVKGETPVVEGKSFVKVNSVSDFTDGNYLIVYEEDAESGYAFNGSLETLDASNNSISVIIAESSIVATDENKASVFTILKTDDGYTIMSASGLYIGQTTDANGLKAQTDALYNAISFTDNGEAEIVSGGAYLRYNANSGQERFRYFKSATYTAQKAVYLYKLTDEEPVTPKKNPELSFVETEFNVEPGADFTAPELVNPYELTVVYSTDDAEIAVVDETTGAVTIGEKEGTATIKASFEGNEEYIAGEASYKITVKAALVPGSDKYELVTDVSTLKVDDEILFAYVDDESATVMGKEQKKANRAAVAATLNDDKTITPNSDAQIIKLEGGWYFNVGNGYLYASSSNANELKTETEKDENAMATISIAKNENTEAIETTVTFQGTNTRNVMRFNPNNGTPLFACYLPSSTTGFLPQIYRKVTSTETLLGDVNDDKKVDVADVTALVNALKKGEEPEPGDIDGENGVNAEDVRALVEMILSNSNQ